MFKVTKIELRDTLATLFREKEDAKPVIEFTSLDMGWIDFSGAPKKMWHNILTVASESENGITDIIKNALSEYEDNQILQSALKNGVILERKKVEKKDEYVPFKNILKYINKDNFGEIKRVDCNRSEQMIEYYDKSKDKSCTITYSIGKIKDKPNSFAERIILKTLEYSKNIDSGEHNCWQYRKPNGDERVDEIPFEICPDLELSKKLFSKKLESLFEGLNMDNAKEYFAHQNYRILSLSINFDYSIGHKILELFTAWMYNTFTGIEKTKFQIFFILTDLQSVEKVVSHINQIVKSLDSVTIIPIQVTDPIKDTDIDSWKEKINLDLYSQEEFVTDLNIINVPKEDIDALLNTKKISMQGMEIFQYNLFDAFIKNS